MKHLQIIFGDGGSHEIDLDDQSACTLSRALLYLGTGPSDNSIEEFYLDDELVCIRVVTVETDQDEGKVTLNYTNFLILSDEDLAIDPTTAQIFVDQLERKARTEIQRRVDLLEVEGWVVDTDSLTPDGSRTIRSDRKGHDLDPGAEN